MRTAMNESRKESCPRREDVAAWVLGSLKGRAARHVAAHLAHCTECAAGAEAVRETVRRMRAAPYREPSPGLTARIMQALPGARAPRPRMRLVFRLARAAALLVVLGGVVLVVTRNQDRRQATADAYRQRLVRQSGEAALWIAAQQEPDGTWSPSRTGGNDAYRPALTALAIMALQRQAPEAQAASIRRGVAALVAMQTPEGAFCQRRGAQLYNHAFAANALFALPEHLAREPAVEAARARALAFSLAAQNPQGGWDYTADGPGNTALSIWQIALLTQARAQGWSDDGGHLRRSLAWLQRQSDGRVFGYRQAGVLPPGGGAGLTLTAMAAATLLDAARTYPALLPAAGAAADAVRQPRFRDDVENPDYYRDYFCARVSAEIADQRALDAIQARLAHAPVVSGGDGTHWVANDNWRQAGGDLYATSLALLSPRASRLP